MSLAAQIAIFMAVVNLIVVIVTAVWNIAQQKAQGDRNSAALKQMESTIHTQSRDMKDLTRHIDGALGAIRSDHARHGERIRWLEAKARNGD